MTWKYSKFNSKAALRKIYDKRRVELARIRMQVPEPPDFLVRTFPNVPVRVLRYLDRRHDGDIPDAVAAQLVDLDRGLYELYRDLDSSS